MKTWGSLVSANASPDRLRQTDDRQTRNLVEKKHAPLTYDATTITSNLVLLYYTTHINSTDTNRGNHGTMLVF